MAVSLVGIELLTIDARIAEAVSRLDIAESGSQSVPDLLGGGLAESGAKAKTKGAIEGAKEAFGLGDRG